MSLGIVIGVAEVRRDVRGQIRPGVGRDILRPVVLAVVPRELATRRAPP